MKLRNKKTGEIGFVYTGLNGEVKACSEHDEKHKCLGQYVFLSELNKEWEDYEDGHRVYYITYTGAVGDILSEFIHPEISLKMKQIGNYFETEEEAEKAVEKLKAWKRLKDEGFRFKTWYGGSKNIDWEITSLENETYIPRQICDDLDLLFGGEE